IAIWKASRGYAYIARRLSSPQLNGAFVLFSPAQVLILKYEDFRSNPLPIVDSIFDFLGIERKSRLKNKQRNVGSYSRKLSAEEREYAAAIFDEDIAKIEKLLDWDCADWRFKANAPAIT